MQRKVLPLGVVFAIGLALPAVSLAAKAKTTTPRPSSSVTPGELAKTEQIDFRQPEKWITKRAQLILRDLKRRPPTAFGAKSIQLPLFANKNDWLTAVYAAGLVDSSIATEMLADKRLLFAILTAELATGAEKYYPRTMGLREFLLKRRLVDANGQLRRDAEEIEEALLEEFPDGFIIRPAVGVAPNEKGHGLFASNESFLAELLNSKSVLFNEQHVKQAVKSHILERVASGEAVVIQEDIVAAANNRHKAKATYAREIRLHTYESQIVPDSVPERWVQTNLFTADDVTRAVNFAHEFLQRLPAEILSRQAFGIDVALLGNGELRITDIITNRGEKRQWSSYLDQPRVIAAYTRFFAEHYAVEFDGVAGTAARVGLVNYFPYWRKRVEMARTPWSQLVAILPPKI